MCVDSFYFSFDSLDAADLDILHQCVERIRLVLCETSMGLGCAHGSMYCEGVVIQLVLNGGVHRSPRQIPWALAEGVLVLLYMSGCDLIYEQSP